MCVVPHALPYGRGDKKLADGGQLRPYDGNEGQSGTPQRAEMVVVLWSLMSKSQTL